MDMEDDWIVVRSKKKHKSRNSNKEAGCGGTFPMINLDTETTIKLIKEIESNLIVHINEFANKTVDRLNRYIDSHRVIIEEQHIQFIVLGLGGPTRYRSSREQIIMAEQIFKRIAPNSIVKIVTLDPAFTDDDRAVVNSRNRHSIEWTVLDDSCSIPFVPEAKEVSPELLNDVTKGFQRLFFPGEPDFIDKSVDEYQEDVVISSILYAPHCPKALYTCLESAFWSSRDNHKYLCILGNITDAENRNSIPCHEVDFPIPLAQDLTPIENNHRAPLFQSQGGLGWLILEKL